MGSVLMVYVINGLAVAALATAIASARPLGPIRKRLGHSSFIGELISCPRCLSYWLAAAAVVIAGAEFGDFAGIVSNITAWLAITAVSLVTIRNMV